MDSLDRIRWTADHCAWIPLALRTTVGANLVFALLVSWQNQYPMWPS